MGQAKSAGRRRNANAVSAVPWLVAPTCPAKAHWRLRNPCEDGNLIVIPLLPILHSAFCILHFAFCILHSAFAAPRSLKPNQTKSNHFFNLDHLDHEQPLHHSTTPLSVRGSSHPRLFHLISPGFTQFHFPTPGGGCHAPHRISR